MLTITKENFSPSVEESDKPVAIDFWAPWCGPCRAMAPILEEMEDELKNDVIIAKVNVDEQPELAGAFGVVSIPTLVLFKEGKPVSKSIGLKGKDDLKTFLLG